jgi:predicted enzyme related to lactoylglutathione lyase
MGPMTYTEWRLDGRPVGGMVHMDEDWPEGIPPHWMVHFAVADCDAAAARTEELGGQVRVPPTDVPPGRFAVVADPHGAVFTIIKLAAAG